MITQRSGFPALLRSLARPLCMGAQAACEPPARTPRPPPSPHPPHTHPSLYSSTGPYKPAASKTGEAKCAGTEITPGGECYFVDSEASNNWVALRVRNSTHNLVLVQSFGKNAVAAPTFDGKGRGVFICQEGDLCAHELYNYGPIVANESYPVMTAERWAMKNDYNATDSAAIDALNSQLKDAYCTSRKVGVDRMGCK